MRNSILFIFISLTLAFIIFSASLYIQPALKENDHSDKVLENAASGRLVWQKYNCQSCHQLYGLGGYLGPDLTNVYSEKGKGEAFIRAMIQSGTIQMPRFDLSKKECDELIAFLQIVDASGNADPRSFKVHSTGMIEAQ